MKSFKSILYIIIGSTFLTFGIIGIFLPLLPTTPFLLLTAFFYMHGSEKLYKWLIEHKKYGPYIKNIIIHKAMKKKDKLHIISVIWMTMSISIYIAPLLIIKISLVFVATIVSIYIFNLKNIEKSKN